MLIASLPWYDLPELRELHDGFWGGVHTRLVARGHQGIPSRLERQQSGAEQILSPDLLVTQTCGYVAAGRATEHVELLLTPHYDAPGCSGPLYSSHIMVRADFAGSTMRDLRGLRYCGNEPLSHSGVNSLRAMVAPLHRGGRFFASVRMLGSHVSCLEALRNGEDDVTATDCVTYALLRRYRPEALDGLRILAQTSPAAAPPLVTAKGTERGLREALISCIFEFANTEAGQAYMEGLLIGGFSPALAATYKPMFKLRDTSLRLGYREMGTA